MVVKVFQVYQLINGWDFTWAVSAASLAMTLYALRLSYSTSEFGSPRATNCEKCEKMINNMRLNLVILGHTLENDITEAHAKQMVSHADVRPTMRI